MKEKIIGILLGAITGTLVSLLIIATITNVKQQDHVKALLDKGNQSVNAKLDAFILKTTKFKYKVDDYVYYKRDSTSICEFGMVNYFNGYIISKKVIFDDNKFIKYYVVMTSGNEKELVHESIIYKSKRNWR